MEFRQMKYILTLAETRNMTRAAEKLYISQAIQLLRENVLPQMLYTEVIR